MGTVTVRKRPSLAGSPQRAVILPLSPLMGGIRPPCLTITLGDGSPLATTGSSRRVSSSPPSHSLSALSFVFFRYAPPRVPSPRACYFLTPSRAPKRTPPQPFERAQPTDRSLHQFLVLDRSLCTPFFAAAPLRCLRFRSPRPPTDAARTTDRPVRPTLSFPRESHHRPGEPASGSRVAGVFQRSADPRCDL